MWRHWTIYDTPQGAHNLSISYAKRCSTLFSVSTTFFKAHVVQGMVPATCAGNVQRNRRETTTANIAKHTLTNKWIREPATPSHHAACKVEYQTFNQSNSQKMYFLKLLHTCQPRCQKTHLVSLNPEHKHVCSPICLLLQENKLMASCGTECGHQNTITFHFLSVRHYSWIQWRVCLLIMSLVLLTFA